VRHLLLRPPLVEALAMDPLGRAGAKAGRDEGGWVVVGEADATELLELLRVAARERAHRVTSGRDQKRQENGRQARKWAAIRQSQPSPP
jgi:hypothetical protein